MVLGAGSRKQRIFLVDDHPLVREWLANLINRQPDLGVCGEAENEAQALPAIAALKPNAAIIDIALKDTSGLRLIEELRRRCPTVAVLVLTMYEESHYAARALQAGAGGYVIKRETSGKIVAAIRLVLSGQTYVSPGLGGADPAHSPESKAPPIQSPAQVLGTRELEVFELLGQGRGTRQIAEQLGMSVKTVESHCAHIKQKLNLSGAVQLLRQAVLWQQRSREG